MARYFWSLGSEQRRYSFLEWLEEGVLEKAFWEELCLNLWGSEPNFLSASYEDSYFHFVAYYKDFDLEFDLDQNTGELDMRVRGDSFKLKDSYPAHVWAELVKVLVSSKVQKDEGVYKEWGDVPEAAADLEFWDALKEQLYQKGVTAQSVSRVWTKTVEEPRGAGTAIYFCNEKVELFETDFRQDYDHGLFVIWNPSSPQDWEKIQKAVLECKRFLLEQ